MVNVLLAQKLHHHLISCAMNRELTWFNQVHDVIHGTEHEDTSEEEVQETNDIINALATWLRSKNMPRLTVLINSGKGAVGVGNGFWKNCGLTVNPAHYEPVYKMLVQECYSYYAGFCGFGPEIQDIVEKRIRDARNDESVNSAEILMVVSEQIEYYGRASTSYDQIHLDAVGDKLIPKNPHKEFFINMAKWFERACHENDCGRPVWDMEFLRGAIKKLRREFTLTIPMGATHNLFNLTLGRELKEGEAYMATVDQIQMLTVCKIEASGQSPIEHISVRDGRLLDSPEAGRNIYGAGKAGTIEVTATGDRERCWFSAHCGGEIFSHVTIHVTFRMN
jgi:hypothetical protein